MFPNIWTSRVPTKSYVNETRTPSVLADVLLNYTLNIGVDRLPYKASEFLRWLITLGQSQIIKCEYTTQNIYIENMLISNFQ